SRDRPGVRLPRHAAGVVMREGGNRCAQRGSFSGLKIVFVPEMPAPMLPPRGWPWCSIRARATGAMSVRNKRIALAGFGAWGQMHAQALATIDGAEIVAIYCHGDASEKAASELVPAARRFRDYPAMLAAGGFDVVDVAVPNFQH